MQLKARAQGHTQIRICNLKAPARLSATLCLDQAVVHMQPVADTMVNKLGNHRPAQRVARQPAQIFDSKRRHLAKMKTWRLNSPCNHLKAKRLARRDLVATLSPLIS